MVHIWWTLTLDPGKGWIVRRYRKVGNLHAYVEAEYDRLERREAVQVLDDDSSWVLTGGA